MEEDKYAEIDKGSTSLTDILDSVDTSRDRNKTFEIDPRQHPITKEELFRFLDFDVELSLHEDNGKLILGVGNEHSPADSDVLNIGENSRLSLHSHPRNSGMPYPSLSDAIATQNHGESTQLMQIGSEGISIYRRAQFDSSQNKPTKDSAKEVLGRWGNTHHIDVLNYEEDKVKDEDVSYFSLSNEEKTQAARDFFRDSDMIVDFIPLNDEEGLKNVLAAINLEKVISDNKYTELPSIMDAIDIDIHDLPLDHAQQGKLNTIIRHFDLVLNRDGRLNRDKELRKGFLEFAHELMNEMRDAGVDKKTEELLQQIGEKAKDIKVD